MITKQGLGTTTELVAPNITVKWNPTAQAASLLGSVDFGIEEIVSRDDSDPVFVVSRQFVSTISADIGEILAEDYVIEDPATGEQVTEPGWKLMAMIKAVVDRRLQLAGAGAPAQPVDA
jgi:hypothetical protein